MKENSMCDFNSLNNEEKEAYHQQLLGAAQSFGGIHSFLQLLETIRETKPHPLTSTNRIFYTDQGTIKWNKTIFDDTLKLLLKARANEGKQDNLLPAKEGKDHKKILNLLRTLKPIVFTVKPAQKEDENGFILQPFMLIDAHTTKLNPLFDALFFCSVEATKKALTYTSER